MPNVLEMWYTKKNWSWVCTFGGVLKALEFSWRTLLSIPYLLHISLFIRFWNGFLSTFSFLTRSFQTFSGDALLARMKYFERVSRVGGLFNSKKGMQVIWFLLHETVLCTVLSFRFLSEICARSTAYCFKENQSFFAPAFSARTIWFFLRKHDGASWVFSFCGIESCVMFDHKRCFSAR